MKDKRGEDQNGSSYEVTGDENEQDANKLSKLDKIRITLLFAIIKVN